MSTPIPACTHQARIQASISTDRQRVVEAERLCYRAIVAGAQLDQLTARLKDVMGTACAAITLVLRDEHHMLSAAGLERVTVAREESICTHMVSTAQGLLVTDAANDPFFAHHPIVKAGMIASYCGTPLMARRGHVVGGICAFDPQPRTFSANQLSQLTQLSREVHNLLVGADGDSTCDERRIITRPPADAERDELEALKMPATANHSFWRLRRAH